MNQAYADGKPVVKKLVGYSVEMREILDSGAELRALWERQRAGEVIGDAEMTRVIGKAVAVMGEHRRNPRSYQSIVYSM